MPPNNKLTYIGETDFRNKRTPFGIKPTDRLRHVYVIGKTGMGKSTFLENMATQDILNDEGFCFIDPHGGSAELLLDYIPEHRINDVLYFAPFEADFPVAMNPLEDVDPDKRHLVVSGLLSVFGKIWDDAWSARMEYILMNTLLALLEYPESTLLSVNRVLTDKEFRKLVIDRITDPTVKSFWVDEYNTWEDRYRKEAGAAIQNKVNQFATNSIVRNIVGQPKSSFDLRDMMDNRKILIVNLSKGQIGEKNAQLLGGMLITKLYLAAMSRADLDAAALATKPPFYFYVDEFQSFANESFADILSEARKYKLGLILAHQYVAQMPDEVRDAVVGNVGTMIVYRIGPADAELFAREFAPVFTEEDIVNLGKWQFYLRLMIDGVGSQPFSASALKPIVKPDISFRPQVIETSRRVYASPRKEVQDKINLFFTPIPTEKDIEHQAYIEKKKAEFKAQGKEWVDFSKEPEKKNEYAKEKTSYQKPAYSGASSYQGKPQNNFSTNASSAPRPFVPRVQPAVAAPVASAPKPPVAPYKPVTPVAPPQQPSPVSQPVALTIPPRAEPIPQTHKPLSNSLQSLLDDLDKAKNNQEKKPSAVKEILSPQPQSQPIPQPQSKPVAQLQQKKPQYDASKKSSDSSLSLLKQALMKAGVATPNSTPEKKETVESLKVVELRKLSEEKPAEEIKIPVRDQQASPQPEPVEPEREESVVMSNPAPIKNSFPLKGRVDLPPKKVIPVSQPVVSVPKPEIKIPPVEKPQVIREYPEIQQKVQTPAEHSVPVEPPAPPVQKKEEFVRPLPSSPTANGPKEIPEDVLRRLLEE